MYFPTEVMVWIDAREEAMGSSATNKSYAKIFQDGTKGNLIREATVLRKAKYATDPQYEMHLNEVAQGRTMKKSIKLAREYHGY